MNTIRGRGNNTLSAIKDHQGHTLVVWLGSSVVVPVHLNPDMTQKSFARSLVGKPRSLFSLNMTLL